MPLGAPGTNSYHSTGSFPPAINGGPPPPTSSPDQPLQPPLQQPLGPPSQYMNGSMGPPPASGRGPPQPHMPAQHGSIPPQPGNMPHSGIIPPQHGGPAMQPGPRAGKSYQPFPVSEYLTFHRYCMLFVPVLSLAHGTKGKTHNWPQLNIPE